MLNRTFHLSPHEYTCTITFITILYLYTNNEWLWVQWYRYFHEVKDRMFYSTRRSQVEKKISSFTEWKYMYHRTNERHSLFVLYNIKNIFCHLECKINLNILENTILFWSCHFRSKVTVVYYCMVLFNGRSLVLYKQVHSVDIFTLCSWDLRWLITWP